MLGTNSLKHYKSKLLHKYFDWEIRNILSIAPLNRTLDLRKGLCVLSMLCKRDFYQYLISIYSFSQILKPEKIVIVNDGSLTHEHIKILKQKIPDVVLLDGVDFIDERVPTYTSWRRMLALESFINDYYVIQLDADLLFRYNLDEIVNAFQSNTSFILGTQQQDKISIEKAQENAIARNCSDNKHVQQLAEMNLVSLKKIGYKSYVRGCAGFAGYAKGSFSTDTLINISDCMFSCIGDTWRNWGSEQTAANILIANQEGSLVLPLETYGSVARYHNELKLIHFLGSWRFDGFIYNRLAKEFIRKNVT
jgi:hypothetical protein